MPYIIKNIKDGYKVCKKNNSDICFSKNPISLIKAKKQLKAIGINEAGILYKDVLNIANSIKKIIKGLYITGSIKRKSKNINDIDFITLNDLSDIITKLKSKLDITIKKKGKQHISILYNNVQIDFWKANNKEELHYMILLRTIDKIHNIAYRKLAKNNNMILNDKGLFKNNKRISFNTEKELRDILGVKGGIIPKDKELYDKIKKRIYAEQPHSLYRSARIIKEYKRAKGEFLEENKKNKLDIPLWFNQKWIDAENYLNDKIVPCGAPTRDKYPLYKSSKHNRLYPLCRPLELFKKLGKDRIKIMLQEKQKLKNKPLITSKLFDTNKFNIKSTIKGYGKKKLIKMSDNLLLDTVKIIAKERGYNPDNITLSNDNKHKLNYNNNNKIVSFGAKGYFDFPTYLYNAFNNIITYDEAIKKMNNYRKRAYKTMIDTNNKYSPASLSYYLLW